MENWWPDEISSMQQVKPGGAWIMINQDLPVANKRARKGIIVYATHSIFTINKTRYKKYIGDYCEYEEVTRRKNIKDEEKILNYIIEREQEVNWGRFGVELAYFRFLNTETMIEEIVGAYLGEECKVLTEEELEEYTGSGAYIPCSMEYEATHLEFFGKHVHPLPKTEEFESVFGSLLLDGMEYQQALFEMLKIIEAEQINYYMSPINQIREFFWRGWDKEQWKIDNASTITEITFEILRKKYESNKKNISCFFKQEQMRILEWLQYEIIPAGKKFIIRSKSNQEYFTDVENVSKTNKKWATLFNSEKSCFLELAKEIHKYFE